MGGGGRPVTIPPDFAPEYRPVPLAEAARIARVSPAELLYLAAAMAGWGPYAITVFHGPVGPLFDPQECRGLACIFEGAGIPLDEPDDGPAPGGMRP
jgi:hypothetical protein